MTWIINNWRSYVWVPSGEVLRGVEVVFLSAVVQALLNTDPGKFASPAVWGVSALIGGALTALEFLKGKLPASS
jgi:hypothetical protein